MREADLSFGWGGLLGRDLLESVLREVMEEIIMMRDPKFEREVIVRRDPKLERSWKSLELTRSS